MRRVIVVAASVLAVTFGVTAATAAPRMVCPIGDDPTVTLFCLAHPCTHQICPH
ncbi:MAG: hypothetical protein M3N21_06910 [Actinomycetota bacterium]|nr:hypothetical protein [Actinomycetota bacterium]